MLRDMLTLGGWLMFILGVILSGFVMGLYKSARSKVGG